MKRVKRIRPFISRGKAVDFVSNGAGWPTHELTFVSIRKDLDEQDRLDQAKIQRAIERAKLILS